MTNSQLDHDRFGDRLDRLVKATQQFKREHETQGRYDPSPVYTLANEQIGIGYTNHLLGILEQQNQLITVLDARLGRLERDSR